MRSRQRWGDAGATIRQAEHERARTKWGMCGGGACPQQPPGGCVSAVGRGSPPHERYPPYILFQSLLPKAATVW